MPESDFRGWWERLRARLAGDPEYKRKKKSSPVKTFIIDSVVVLLLLLALYFIAQGRKQQPQGQFTEGVPTSDAQTEDEKDRVASGKFSAPNLQKKGETPSVRPKKVEKKTAPAPSAPKPVVVKPSPAASPAPQPPTSSVAKEAPAESGKPKAFVFTDNEYYQKSTAPVPTAGGSRPQPVAAPQASQPKAPAPPTPQQIEPIASRPVAKDAPPALDKVEKPSIQRSSVIRIRFAVCKLEESCVQVRDSLAGKGVKTVIEKTMHEIKTYHVALGPWPTRANAENSGAQLAKVGIKSSLLVSGDKYFMISAPEYSEAHASKTRAAAASAGFEGKVFSRKETSDMYKVYSQPYPDRVSATRQKDQYRKKGIDCILEGG